MTTLRDLLHDFALEIAGIDSDNWTDEEQNFIDEYIDKIKSKLIG